MSLPSVPVVVFVAAGLALASSVVSSSFRRGRFPMKTTMMMMMMKAFAVVVVVEASWVSLPSVLVVVAAAAAVAEASWVSLPSVLVAAGLVLASFVVSSSSFRKGY